MRALQDAGLRVPTDVSVIGFDDIWAAAFISPSLTTIRQPLRKMGWMASEYLLGRLQGAGKFREEIVIYPSLAVRESTAAVAHADDGVDSHRKARKGAKNRDVARRNRIAALAKE
jgi:LacI family transcriptional regulator